jgi:ABC transporter DrrB family efflux protein
MTDATHDRPYTGSCTGADTVADRPRPRDPVAGPPDEGAATALVSPRMVAATAVRVLTQLRRDRRTTALLLVVPSLLLALTNGMFDGQPSFDWVALSLLGILPFVLMFMITSIAMLRERTGGTLERLLTTPMSKLDLLLGYGIAFAVAATLQATLTCATAYLLLGLYTPGNPLLVIAVSVAGALLGMALGLLASALATSEFQAVQFMPVVAMPQIMLGGLFIPRKQMADQFEAISNVLPLTYSIEAMHKLGETSLITGELIGDVLVVLAVAFVALALAASTLRRRAGDRTRTEHRRLMLLPATAVVALATVGVSYGINHLFYVSTDDARIDGDRYQIVAPVDGVVVGWRAGAGSTLRQHQVIGRIEMTSGFGRSQWVMRAPTNGTVARAKAPEGMYVTAGTELATVYEADDRYVTARIDETDRSDVRLGQTVDVTFDGAPGKTFTGFVVEIQDSTAGQFSTRDPQNTTVKFARPMQVIPVKMALFDWGNPDLNLVPGMNATVKIHKDW